jgi:hypothetical protein
MRIYQAPIKLRKTFLQGPTESQPKTVSWQGWKIEEAELDFLMEKMDLDNNHSVDKVTIAPFANLNI